MSAGERNRTQLVVHLGEGSLGEERRQALEDAATARGETLSAWARTVLFAAAGMPSAPVTHAELAELERRVAALEARKPLQTGMVNGTLLTRALDCSGCMFPHGLCGPCSRWNGR